MLTAMRGATGGIVAKTFLILLAGSFAVWGVADVFTGSRDQVLAKVGEREISAVEFRNFFDQRLQSLSRSSGQPITVAQGRQFGLDRQILGDLLRAGALDEQAKSMKMSVSDAFIAKQVADNPAYHDATGKFSPSTLQLRLSQANVSEQQFVANERNNMIRNAITQTISDGLDAPKSLVKLMVEQANEKRDISYFTVTGDGLNIAEPSDKQVKAFYDVNKSKFNLPERRVFETMFISAAELGKSAVINDDILKKTYEKEKSRFGSPETRIIEQIPFANKEEAAAALKTIREGTSFESVATGRGLSEKDRLLGTFNRKNVPDEQLGQVAFKLKEGAVSEPVIGKLSIFLIKVTKITPENIKTLSDVRDELVKTIQVEAGRDEILNLRDKVEDERGGGTSFKDIAKSLELTYKITPAVNRIGLDTDGKPVTDIPDWNKVLQAGNASDAGFEIDPVASRDDGFVWVNVVEVVQSHTEPFADAKAKAVDLWKVEELRTAVKAKAEGFEKQANDGTDFKKLAAEAGVEIKQELGINRRTASAKFDGNAVKAAFDVPVDKVTISLNADGKSAKVMSQSPVLAPPYDPSSTEAKEIGKQLKTLVNNDVFAGYMSDLQKTVGVEIRPEAWARVFQTQ